MNCRYCGCTETSACMTEDGPCYWHRPGYCSACAAKHLEQLVDAACHWSQQRKPGEHEATLRGFPFRIAIAPDGRLLALDGITVPVFGISEGAVFLAPHYDALELLSLFQEAQARAA